MAIKIGIIGAGPAGLVTAIALEKYCLSNKNVEITLIDKNESAIDYPGVEYGIQERACKALNRIGIKEKALACGLKTHRISFFNSRTNKKQKFGVKTNPELTTTVIRQEFLGELTNLLDFTKIYRQHNVKNINATSSNVSVTCETKEDKDKVLDFDLLIAADGIGSIVRKDYFKNENYIHLQGFSCLYMLIDVPENAPQFFKDFSNTGECYIVLGKTTTATFFPMGKNRFAVGIGFDDQVQTEMWKFAGINKSLNWSDLNVIEKEKIATLLAEDCSFQDDMLTKAFEWIPDWNSFKIYLWKMRDSDVATNPVNEFGNVIMIGDAAHAIMPTIGMGASLAIEDAEILGQFISDQIIFQKINKTAENDFKKILEDYSKQRVPLWIDLMERARAGAKLNFIGIRKKSRLSFGPQVPIKYLWKIVAKIEEIIS
jgi:salicylate hydroxylase